MPNTSAFAAEEVKAREPVRGLLIAGTQRAAAHLALQRIGKAKTKDQGLLVLDYAGRLAQHLNAANSKSLHRTPISWFDLCNRRKSIAVWRMTACTGLPLALGGFLRHCAQRLKVALSPDTLTQVCGLAGRLAGSGTMGLVSLAQSLKRPELTASMRQSAASSKEIDALADMLLWILRFPLVWAACEGRNLLDAPDLLSKGHTLWLEIGAHYAETLEHEILGWMLQASLVQTFAGDQWPQSLEQRPAPIWLHAFAQTQLLGCLESSLSSLAFCKHVILQELEHEGALKACGQSWIDAQAHIHKSSLRPDCWVVGGLLSPLLPEKNLWLDESQCKRLHALKAHEVWVQSGKDKKAVVMLMQEASVNDAPAIAHRRAAWRSLKLGNVKQWGYAPPESAIHAPPNADIYRFIADATSLLMGWLRVKVKRKDSHGIDKVTIKQFSLRMDDELLQLEQELRDGSYRPRPLRTIRLEKPDGGERLIKVACVRDRVVQAAFLHQIEPLLEPHFSKRSFAYRVGRGPVQALAIVRSAIRSGKRWAVVADIQKCFDTIDHDILMRLFADRIADRDVLKLLRHWLQADVFDMGDVRPADLGLAQGETISPMLANLYLDPMDKVFEREGLEFVRYADDYVLLCDSEAQARAALSLMGGFLQESLHLSLKPAKTQLCALSDGIEFLGFALTQDSIRIPADKIIRVKQAMLTWVQLAAEPDALQTRRVEAMQRLNALIRGFRNYYAVDSAPLIEAQLADLDRVLADFGQRYIQQGDAAQLLWSSRECFCEQTEPVASALGLPAYADLAHPRTNEELVHAIKKEANFPEDISACTAISVKSMQEQTPELQALPEAIVRIERSLHVMRRGCYITRRDDLLVIRQAKKDVYSCPMNELDMVMLEGMGIALSCDLGMHLAQRDIALILAPLVGQPSAALQALASGKANLRREQAIRALEPDVARAGLAMLSAKTANQASVLHYFAKYRKKTDYELHAAMHAAADVARQVSSDLACMDPSDHQLRTKAMGLEGRAASHYWSAMGQLVPTAYQFPGRQTHRAADPINSAMNYLYSLLYAQVWRAVVSAGLDPYFGIIHRSQRDQGSLVFDVIEEFRAPFADKVLFSLLGRGLEIRLDKDGLLDQAVRKKLMTAFYKNYKRSFSHAGQLTTGAKLLAAQIRLLRHVFLATGEYSGYKFRW